MRRLLFILVVLLPGMMIGQQAPALMNDVIGEYGITVHTKLSSSCEVIEPATLIEYKRYDAFKLAGAHDENYSPVLSKWDFIEISEAVPRKAIKSAKKSGFKVHVEPAAAMATSDRPVANGTNCPDLQQAVSQLDHQRDERRVELQQHLHRIGSDVTPPVPLPQAQAKAAASQAAAPSSASPKVRKTGTVILATAVGIDGKVHAVKLLQSLDAALDQKAIEAVRQWQFAPARMRGLPVPVEIDVEFNFRLY